MRQSTKAFFGIVLAIALLLPAAAPARDEEGKAAVAGAVVGTTTAGVIGGVFSLFTMAGLHFPPALPITVAVGAGLVTGFLTFSAVSTLSEFMTITPSRGVVGILSALGE